MIAEQLKYPIGKFEKISNVTEQQLAQYILDIETLPSRLKKQTEHLYDQQLDTPYRPEGWTIRQVVHHFADSHMNSFIRFKLALTEDNPIIKPYEEDLWVQLGDSKKMAIKSSLMMIEGIHERWVFLLNSLTKAEFNKTFIHPQKGKPMDLYETTGLYAWHSNHHLAHIVNLKERMNWL